LRRGPPILPLSLFAAAFGFEECAIVVYLRRLAFPNGYPGGDPLGLQVASLPVYHLEAAREASTIVLLVVLAWLSAREAGMRWRAFLYVFGLWDIVYYVGLWSITGHPAPLEHDVLFLIPVPWVAPVWAAMAFAVAFVVLGVLGFERRRAPLFGVGLALGLASFIAGGIGASNAYPLWLFLPAIALALAAVPFETIRA